MNILTTGKGEVLKLDYSQLKTLTGLTIGEALVQLQRELEPSAYKKVTGGGKELTDIKPAWLTEELTKVFGIVGVGWYYGFDTPEVRSSIETAKSGRTYTLYQANINYGWLVYRLTDGEHIVESEHIQATGGSDNEVEEYAVRGAVTNMLGAAASKLCWQLFIYKGEKEGPRETTSRPVDARPWFRIALSYADEHPEVKSKLLKETDAGKRVLAMLPSMIGAEKWWAQEKNMANAIKLYAGGHLIPGEMTWPEFERLVRTYEGPYALAGHTISDVRYQHYFKPSEWQNIMAAIPVMEDMVLTEEMADALNIIIPAAGSFVVKGKGVDTETIAANLRQHFIKLAETEVPPTSELVEEVGKSEEIPY